MTFLAQTASESLFVKGGTYRSDPIPPHPFTGNQSGSRYCLVTTSAAAMRQSCKPCFFCGAFAFLGQELFNSAAAAYRVLLRCGWRLERRRRCRCRRCACGRFIHRIRRAAAARCHKCKGKERAQSSELHGNPLHLLLTQTYDAIVPDGGDADLCDRPG